MDPTERPYNLVCTVKCLDRAINEDLGNGKINSYMSLIVLLIPEQTDECMHFYRAWLPEVPEEKPEVNAQLSVPVAPFSRVAVCCGPDRNNTEGRFEGPYLFVMNTGLAKWLKKNKDGQRIVIKILSESEEGLMDQGIDDDAAGSYDLIPGQTSFGG